MLERALSGRYLGRWMREISLMGFAPDLWSPASSGPAWEIAAIPKCCADAGKTHRYGLGALN